ncbi:MAG: hypothetical protein Ct9H300mP31_00950 [Acidimicrobiaceae bacterium]|nr:MAG: hypothetical protein Ct9H300mP31_00950 [Acidimicrobiaceae bacterium]
MATAAFGFLSFGAYAQSFFDTPGTPVMEEALYVVMAFAIVPVALAILGGVADTLRRGASNLGTRPPAEVVCALLSVLLIVAGTAVGALRVIAPLDLLVPRSPVLSSRWWLVGQSSVWVLAFSTGVTTWWVAQVPVPA